MANGSVQVFSLVIASGASTSSEVDLGRGFSKVMFDCTGAGGQTQFHAAASSGGTSRLIKYPVISGLVAPSTFMVGSAVSGSLVEVTALQGFRYVKVAATGTIANGATLYLYGADV